MGLHKQKEENQAKQARNMISDSIKAKKDTIKDD
jgi:hypothetical protein